VPPRHLGVASRPVARAVVLALGAIVLAACSLAGGPDRPPPETGQPTVAAPPAPREASPAPGPDPADRLAGLLDHQVPEAGTGEFVPVPGDLPAPGPGRVRTVRVEIERGVAVDGEAFADFVMTTLNDPRSWGRGGAMSFARTADAAPLQVVLATPETGERLCRPLETSGRLSCREGDRAVISLYRWTYGTPDYTGDLTSYRRYVINHEVGHWLGHSHDQCPAPGTPAPVMQQQTFGLDGCARNPWPYPDSSSPS
jgi:hypothetical protein